MSISDHVIREGHLDVGRGHKIHYVEWGNPKAPPIMQLHGGPGSRFKDNHTDTFNPAIHHVIFHDQRGCGESTPLGSLEHNTTADLVDDIEKLRRHLSLGKVHIMGASWGSTLALCYAIAHPGSVKSLLVSSIYLARQADNDYFISGYPRLYFPEAWERFIGHVPPEHHGSPTAILKFYADKIRSKKATEAQRFAAEWGLWEHTLISVRYDQNRITRETEPGEECVPGALIGTEYYLNGCYLPENYILDTIGKIQHIPCAIIHGRFDVLTPPVQAHDLYTAYGPNARLTWVNSGHSSNDSEMNAALRATVNALLI